MKLISELKDLNKDTIKGSHITIHLAIKFVGMDKSQVNKQTFYHKYAKDILEAKCRFGIDAFPGVEGKVEKKHSKPIRYDGEWVVNKLIQLK
tara:strand:+ start:216 stop:491 length:276 start_codon:yes stop_codon:yes gene_type:complete